MKNSQPFDVLDVMAALGLGLIAWGLYLHSLKLMLTLVGVIILSIALMAAMDGGPDGRP